MLSGSIQNFTTFVPIVPFSFFFLGWGVLIVVCFAFRGLLDWQSGCLRLQTKARKLNHLIHEI